MDEEKAGNPKNGNLRVQLLVPRCFVVAGFSLLLVLFALSLPSESGNDGAASVGAGGIQLRREARISMEKERLTISLMKVTVEYEFLNETDKEITTEVAFPIPPYRCDFVNEEKSVFPDFQVWAEGIPVAFQTDTRATLKGGTRKDYVALLREFGLSRKTIELEEEGICYSPSTQTQIGKVSKANLKKLFDLGLIDAASEIPQWTVSKTYHWTTTFPVHRILHVRHEYTPAAGSSQIPLDYVGPAMKIIRGGVPRKAKREVNSPDMLQGITRQFRDACFDPKTAPQLPRNESGFVFANWVDYVLTTANTWKTPIKDFELIVDKTNPWDRDPVLVSFCWDGPVKRLDENRYLVKKKDFVPKKELAVYFYR